MEATVRALDEQKSELEKVIAALKKEEAEEEGLMAENAGDDVAGDGTDDAVGDAAETNVDDEGAVDSVYQGGMCHEHSDCVGRIKCKEVLGLRVRCLANGRCVCR
ncbi:hypothetical protein P8452_59123 [Trifolium repens]|nr:hypothetical protein P8452_59123 [Trifolium repens]